MKRSNFILFPLIIAVIFLAGCGGGGNSGGGGGTGTGTVEGYLYYDDVNKTLQITNSPTPPAASRKQNNASVDAQAIVAVPGGTITLAGTPYTTVTGSNGHFVVSSVPAGTYNITATYNTGTTTVTNTSYTVTVAGGGTATPTIPGNPTPFSIDESLVPGATSFPTGTDDAGVCTTVNYPYYIAKYQVTYQLWYTVYSWATDAARGINQYHFQNAGREGSIGIIGAAPTADNQHPVTKVSWRDAVIWCNALTEYYNAQNGTNFACVYAYNSAIVRDSRDANASDNVTAVSTAKGFRLPLSMEWELAARYKGNDSSNGAISMGGLYWTPGEYASGATAKWSWSDTTIPTQAVAWYEDNSSGSTHPVGQKIANALGLYDMGGNVWQWCFEKNVQEPQRRVIRGGSFGAQQAYTRVGFFGSGASDNSIAVDSGFRVVRTQ